jgi:tetratricopeptide (TPR) repeat protein
LQVIWRLAALRCALAALALACGGCPLPPVISLATLRPQDLPADPIELEKKAEELEAQGDRVALENALVVRKQAMVVAPRSFDAAWRAAHLAAHLAEEAVEGDKEEKSRRQKFAGQAVQLAEKAIALDDKRVEGHYYRAIGIGLDASTRTVGAYLELGKMADEAKKAAAIDPAFDHAGPERILGALLARAPAWPASIGDLDEGKEHLERALKLAPDYPPNHLYYCQALESDGKKDLARAECHKVVDAPARPEWSREQPRWRAEAQSELRKL